jgi:hypothetical protein
VPDELAVADAVLHRIRRWNRRSWDVPAGGGTRADVTHAAVQRLADLAAQAEGRPSVPVPRLFGDQALPDQLAVMVIDLRRVGDPATLRSAAEELTSLRDVLGLR